MRPLIVSQFAAAFLARLLGAFVCGSVIRGIDAQDAATWSIRCLLAAALLCGIGLQIPADKLLQRKLRRLAGFVVALPGGLACLLMLAGGAFAPALLPIGTVNFCLLAAFPAGLAIGSDWGSLSDMARGSVPHRLRWDAMRFWNAALPLGFLLAVASPSVTVSLGLGTALCAAVCVCLLLELPVDDMAKNIDWCDSGRSSANSDAALPACQQTPGTHAAHSQDSSTAENECQEVRSEDCDAVECCCGAKVFQPTGFGYGVGLSLIGWLILWFVFTGLSSADGFFAVAGVMAGFLIAFSAAPRVGYVVLAVMFSAVGVVVGVAGSVWTPQTVLVSAVTGLCSGAVFCSISAMTGELFADCADNPVRTRVLSVSAFAASFLLLLASLLPLPSATVVGLLFAGVFFSAILTIRVLPNPVLSSLGLEGEPDTDDDEFRDVMESLKRDD